jgi:hypothetical protein
MKLLWHSYLVPGLRTRAMKLCTETHLPGRVAEASMHEWTKTNHQSAKPSHRSRGLGEELYACPSPGVLRPAVCEYIVD